MAGKIKKMIPSHGDLNDNLSDEIRKILLQY
jgi:hypothetical protein